MEEDINLNILFPVLLSLLNFYRQLRSCGQGNIFTPVCHSVHRGVYLVLGGVYLVPGVDLVLRGVLSPGGCT